MKEKIDSSVLLLILTLIYDRICLAELNAVIFSLFSFGYFVVSECEENYYHRFFVLFGMLEKD